MKKLIYVSTLFLLTITSSYSQNIYPKKQVIEGDTVVTITTLQLKSINQLLLERKIYKEAIGDMQVKSLKLKQDIAKINNLSANKSALIVKQKAQIADLSRLTANYTKNIDLMKKEISNQKRKKFRSTFIAITATALVTSTTVLLLK